MKFLPNIDEEGAQARLTGSRIALVLAAFSLFLPVDRWIALSLFGFFFLVGVVMRYQAKKKWCVLRACGIKTAK
jgi:hypothetical protein